MAYQLIHSPIHPDLLSAGKDILEGIRSGQIVGLCVTVHLRRHKFFVDFFGEIANDPHWGRAACLSLDDCLRDVSRGRQHPGATTI